MSLTPEQITAKLNEALDLGGPALTQCLLDLGMLKREGNRLVRTRLGDHAVRTIDTLNASERTNHAA